MIAIMRGLYLFKTDRRHWGLGRLESHALDGPLGEKRWVKTVECGLISTTGGLPVCPPVACFNKPGKIMTCFLSHICLRHSRQEFYNPYPYRTNGSSRDWPCGDAWGALSKGSQFNMDLGNHF